MEQSTAQSPLVRRFLKILRFIGIYLLGFIIVYLLSRENLFSSADLNPVLLLVYLFIVVPLVWAFSKSFFAGFVKYAVMIGIMMLVSRVPSKYYTSGSSDESAQSALGYVGNYSANENGIQVKIMVTPTRWYSEIIDGSTGNLITSEAGEINEKSLYDQYGIELGKIEGNRLNISIQGQLVRLKKD